MFIIIYNFNTNAGNLIRGQEFEIFNCEIRLAMAYEGG